MIDNRCLSVDEQIMPPIIEAYAKGEIDSAELEERLKRKINDNCSRDKDGSDIVRVFLRDKVEVVNFSGEIMMDVIVR